MTNESSLSPELQDNLVAYLDGELDEVATQEMERTLAENSSVRDEVAVLTRSFEMLDELPRPQLSEEFTERTLATVQLSQQSEVDAPHRISAPSRLRPRAVLVGWIVGLALSVALGVLLGGRIGRDDSERLVEELPVLKNLDIYGEIGSIEYLRKLEERGVLNDNE